MSKLTHENVVKFLAYSVKPSAIVFELCEVKASDDTIIHNVAEIIDLFNDKPNAEWTYLLLDKKWTSINVKN